MAPESKQKQDAAALATFKYGMPVYGLAWPQDETFYLCGGGGMGIKNRVVGAQRLQGMLTDQVTDFDFGDNCPTRLAVTPNGKSIAVAMSKGGIKRLDIDAKGSKIKLTEVSGDLAQRLAADKSEIKCLAFTPRGDTLILGGVDGSLKIVAWPSLEVKMHLTGDAKLPDGVRDVSGAPGPRATRCAVVLEDGTAQIWDWDTKEACCKMALGKRGEPIASNTIMNMVGPSTSALQELPTGMLGARFASLRYAPLPSTTPALPAPGTPSTPTAGTSGSGASERVVLHALMNNRMGSWVVTWEQDFSGMLTMSRYKRVGEEPASCFDLSPCGKLLAVGTSDAAILVLNSADLSIVRVRHKAHTVFCTGVCFAPDSQHVLSVSGDASATLTPTTPLKSSIETIHRFIVGLVLLLAFMMAGLLVTVRIAKATGNRQLVEQIGTLLRFLNIIDN